MIVNQIEHVESTKVLPVLVVLQCSMLSALAVILGQAFSAIPNVEFVSIVLFISGILGGVTGGVVTAVTTTISFNYLNPLGPNVPPIILCQVVAWSITAMCGAIFSRYLGFPCKKHHLPVAGVFVTLQYQLIMNLGYFVVFGESLSLNAFAVVMAAGFPLMLIHVVSNGVIFHMLGASLIEIVKRYSTRKNSSPQ